MTLSRRITNWGLPDMGDGKENLHKGHRDRVRGRFLAEGLDAFEDHQVLEFLLFFATPQRDTNNTAHLLLKRYGSLSAVLEADPLDLARTEGVGKIAATLLSLVPSLTRRYEKDRVRQERCQLTTVERAAEFLIPLMAGRSEEVFYLVCLDTRCRVIVPALIATGLPNRAHVEPRKVVEAALRHRAHTVILAHNHPTGQARPSTADHRVTESLVHALRAIGINVQDHIIVAGKEWYSFSRRGDLPTTNVNGGRSS